MQGARQRLASWRILAFLSDPAEDGAGAAPAPSTARPVCEPPAALGPAPGADRAPLRAPQNPYLSSFQ